MRKIKKSLAVILSALMLASFMPLFASAATTINRNNVKIVPPSVSPAEINYGQTLADVTLSGGECWYVDPDTGAETLVPGHFEVRSTTTKPAVSDAYSVPIKFVSDDTTQYSNISSLLAALTTVKSGTWPTLKVIGQDGVLVSAPTAAEIQTGQQLREATLSGGVVNDADGNAVTGTWSYVYPSSYPAASGKYEVQFKATGYNTIKTTIDVTVTSSGNASVSELPVAKRLIVGDYLSYAYFANGTGKVVDESGTEITTGRWSILNDATQDAGSIKFTESGTYTYKAQWAAIGYPVLTVEIPIIVGVDKGYEITTNPTVPAEVQMITNMTYADVPITPGVATIPGTWAFSSPASTITKTSTYSGNVVFTPDDLSYESTSFAVSFTTVKSTSWLDGKIDNINKIVIPYGFQSSFVNNKLSYFPQEIADVCEKIIWFDYIAADHEPGDIQLVNCAFIATNSKVNGWIYKDLYIQIEPANYTGELGNFSYTSVDKVTGKILVKFSCDIKGITGTVTIKEGDNVLATLTPDENGKISSSIEWAPDADGTYNFTADYEAGLLDKTNVQNTHLEFSKDFDISDKYTVTIKIGDKVITEEAYEGTTFYKAWSDMTDLDVTTLASWKVTDADGNTVTIKTPTGGAWDGTSSELYFLMPSQDIVVTAISAFGEEIDNNAAGGTLGSLMSFWQKLIDFIVEIYRTIIDFFVPAVV